MTNTKPEQFDAKAMARELVAPDNNEWISTREPIPGFLGTIFRSWWTNPVDKLTITLSKASIPNSTADPGTYVEKVSEYDSRMVALHEAMRELTRAANGASRHVHLRKDFTEGALPTIEIVVYGGMLERIRQNLKRFRARAPTPQR